MKFNLFLFQGIVTWLSIYPSGIQMEHPAAEDPDTINSLFYYPIKSIIYCGAVRFTNLQEDGRPYRFVPLDTQAADLSDFVKNPPLFVVFLKAIDSTTKAQVIECNLYVVDTKKTAMKLVESCQKAYDVNKISVETFFQKYNYVPVVYFLKDVLPQGKNKMIVKSFDIFGYFYATESNSIEVCQLLDYNSSKPKIYDSVEPDNYDRITDGDEMLHDLIHESSGKYFDPFTKTEDLIRVEPRLDPSSGQNIYVRYIKDKKSESRFYDVHGLLYNDEMQDEESNSNEQPKVLVRQEKTPSPIIFEKYIKKKAPQVIIKEIHVHEPAPPPIKIVQKLNRNPQYPVPLELPQSHNQYPHTVYPRQPGQRPPQKQILPDEMPPTNNNNNNINNNNGSFQNQPKPIIKKVFHNQQYYPEQRPNIPPPASNYRVYDEYNPPNPYSLYSNFTRYPPPRDYQPRPPINNVHYPSYNQYPMQMNQGYGNPYISYCEGNDCCYENYKLDPSYSELYRQPRRLKSYKEPRRTYDIYDDDKYSKYKKHSRSESRKKYEKHSDTGNHQNYSSIRKGETMNEANKTKPLSR